MKVPKYVQEIMKRTSYTLDEGEPGYTIKIYKRTEWVQVQYFRKEILKLKHWADRQMPADMESPVMVINQLPQQTHYCDQYAIVTIYDPVMMELEKYIPSEQTALQKDASVSISSQNPLYNPFVFYR